MKKLQGNEMFSNILMNQLVEDETLYNMINVEDSIPKLSNILQLLYERVNRNLAEKQNFSVAQIIESDSSFDLKKNTLSLALHVQADNTELKKCLCLFNEKLTIVYLQDTWEENNDLLQLLCIADAIVEFEWQFTEEIFLHVEKLKMFLLKICGINFTNEVSIDKASFFFKYFEIIISKEKIFIDETVQYFIKEENLNFLCLLFERKLNYVVASDIFQKDDLWDFVKVHITSDSNVKKKQGQYILWRSIEYFRTNDSTIPVALEMQSIRDWDFFFVLLEMSAEKQLHLILPPLKLLRWMTNLHITWQICVYKELLKHSQLIVVHKTVEHILQLSFTSDKVNQQLLHHTLVALNKFEYSNSSKNIFKKLEIFCSKLPDSCCNMLFEEFSNVEWNPAAAWCVLNSTSSILHKVPEHLIIPILQCLKKLPHLYIKQGCIILFIKKFLNNSSSFIKNFPTIGKLLIQSGREMYTEIFQQIINEKTVELENCHKILTEMVLKSVEEKNVEYVVTYSEIMKKLNMELDFKLETPYSILEDILVFYFPNLLNPFDIKSYVVQRFENIQDDDYRYLLKFLEMSIEKNLSTIKSDDCRHIWNLSQGSETKRLIAVYMIYKLAVLNEISLDSQLVNDCEIELESSKCDKFKLWIELFRQSFKDQPDEQQVYEIIYKYLEFLNFEDDDILFIIIDNLEPITKHPSTFFAKSDCLKVLDICLKRLSRLPNNLMKTYGIVFFKSIFELNLFSQPLFLEYWEKWYKDYFDSFMEHEILMKVMLEGCRKIILQESPHTNILTPLILSAITKGTVVQKNQRVEYGICQEIHNCIGATSIKNPNVKAMELKMLWIECLYLLAKDTSLKNSPCADGLMDFLLDRYMENYKKRYFPNSKIHLEKLRIVQAMLMLVYFTENTNEKLVQFILNSFCEESHQPSVRQLLQWMLIILVSKSSCYVSLMIQKVDAANLSHPSSVVAVIPVLYHLVTSLDDEEYWNQVTDAILPWTMGPNFKLRVYSQIALSNILKVAKKKKLTKYIERYSFLENCITTVIDTTGNAVTENLKDDMNFIENFDMNTHYTVENIFFALPKMLGVLPSEWENALEYKFSEKFEVAIESLHKIPSKIATETSTDNEEVNELVDFNVQRKIIPWKQDLEEKVENKSLSSLICVASLIEKSSNLGGLSRTCEIFNVKQLVLHNMKIINDKEFKHLSMSSENWVDFMEVKKEDLWNFLVELRQQGYQLVGLEQTSESSKLDRFEFQKKTAFILGNEKEGIPAPLLPVLDICIEIPQFGQTRSLNVHVAGATCIWEYVRQHML